MLGTSLHKREGGVTVQVPHSSLIRCNVPTILHYTIVTRETNRHKPLPKLAKLTETFVEINLEQSPRVHSSFVCRPDGNSRARTQ